MNESGMLRWMRGVRQKDQIKNEYVRGENGINLLKTITRKSNEPYIENALATMQLHGDDNYF